MTRPGGSPSTSTEPDRGRREVPMRIAVLAVAILISAATAVVTAIDFLPNHPAHLSPALSACWSLTVLLWILQWFVAHNAAERRRHARATRTRHKVEEIERRLEEVEGTLDARGKAIRLLESRIGLPPGTVDNLLLAERSDSIRQGEVDRRE